jgi:hypothetical protein
MDPRRTPAGQHRDAETGLLIAGGVTVILLTGIIWLATEPLRIWHVTGADGQPHPDTATWIAYGISGALLVSLLVFISVYASNRRPAATPPPSVREALGIAGTLPPLCHHPGAVRVESAVDPDQTLAWWCPACKTQLDPGFMAAELTPDSTWPAIRRPWKTGCLCASCRAGLPCQKEARL